MQNINTTKFELFDWCKQNNIDFILEHPRLEINKFSSNETNLIINDIKAKLIVNWCKDKNFTGTVIKNDNGYQVFFEDINWQLSLITKLSYMGIDYLKIRNLDTRKEAFGDFFHLEDIDQVIIIVIKSCVSTNKNFRYDDYKNFVYKVLNLFPNAIAEKLIEIFGIKNGLEIFDDMRKNFPKKKIKYRLTYLFIAIKKNAIHAMYSILVNIGYKFYIFICCPKAEFNK